MAQALYREYRPQTFDDVVGQDAVTQTLKNQIIAGKVSHAYLFTGTRGTGKTSCAKILAKAVNCLSPENGSPCCRCSACQGIESGSVLDVQEIDAASNNGVDNVRSIRDDAVYAPVEVKKRVYIIDEVHMLSMAAFNALLKTIEEPPEHLMFILATTELAKVPATILSRCQRFAFRRPTPEEITGRIRVVAAKENIAIDTEAAELLGRLADGAFRDGLSLLDQCASAKPGQKLTQDSVYETLGLVGQRQTMELMEAVAGRDTGTALQLFSQLYSAGKNAASLLGELSTLARDLLIMKTAPESGIGMVSSICTGHEIRQLLPRFTTEELIRMIDLIQETTGGFKTSLNQRVDGELCLVHLCQPAISNDSRNLLARISHLEGELADRFARMEQQLSSGELVIATRSSTEPSVVEDEPEVLPVETGLQAQLEPDDGTWEQICRRAAPEIDVVYRPFLDTLTGKLQGRTLVLIPQNDYMRSMVNRPEILEPLKRQSAVVLGYSVGLRLSDPDGGKAGDLLKQMAEEFGGLDNITVKT